MKFNFEKENNIKKQDPMQSSPVAENLKLEKTNETIPYFYGENKKKFIKILKDDEQGKFIEKDPDLKPEQQDLKTEYLISLLIKGIFHSSDIIKKDNKYYSKKIDFNQIEDAEKGELEAELFLLRYLFSDWDKNVPNDNINTKGNKFAHYDYSEAFRGSLEKKFKINTKTEDLIEQTKKELDSISKYKEPLGFKRKAKTALTKIGLPFRKKEIGTENKILNKSKEILSRIEDNIFWEAIIKKSEFDTTNKRFDFLQSENKIEELRKIIKSRLKKIIEIIKQRNTEL